MCCLLFIIYLYRVVCFIFVLFGIFLVNFKGGWFVGWVKDVLFFDNVIIIMRFRLGFMIGGWLEVIVCKNVVFECVGIGV